MPNDDDVPEYFIDVLLLFRVQRLHGITEMVVDVVDGVTYTFLSLSIHGISLLIRYGVWRKDTLSSRQTAGCWLSAENALDIGNSGF